MTKLKEEAGSLAKVSRPTEPENHEEPESSTHDYSIELLRYKNGKLVEAQIGEAGKGICKEAARLANAVYKSKMPLPVVFRFTPESSYICYGPEREITRDITEETTGLRWALNCVQYGVQAVEVTISGRRCARVEYGRGNKLEFRANIEFGKEE